MASPNLSMRAGVANDCWYALNHLLVNCTGENIVRARMEATMDLKREENEGQCGLPFRLRLCDFRYDQQRLDGN